MGKRYNTNSPLSSNVVVWGHCFVTLSFTINETLKWLSSLPTLMQKSSWWWQCCDRHIISLSPHFQTPFPPFSPSLISLVLSVDVKHHVYLLEVIFLQPLYQLVTINLLSSLPTGKINLPTVYLSIKTMSRINQRYHFSNQFTNQNIQPANQGIRQLPVYRSANKTF